MWTTLLSPRNTLRTLLNWLETSTDATLTSLDLTNVSPEFQPKRGDTVIALACNKRYS